MNASSPFAPRPKIAQPPVLPMTRKEMEALGWSDLDVLLITGDCYVDHPSFGVPLIGRILIDEGFRVGVIAQPDWNDPEALKVMGRPLVGVGVSSGNMDSMVNIYTAGRRKRRDDAFSINGETGKRPPHALVVYAQLVKRAFPGIPVELGGLESSMRRIAHYDYWQDKIRPGVLVDAKAEIGMYGMGERPIREVFQRFANHQDLSGIPGTFRLLGKKAAEAFDPGDRYAELPSYEAHLADKDALMESTKLIERATNPWAQCGTFQRYGDRILVVEPPPLPLSTAELDAVYDLGFSGKPHPAYQKLGRIPAYETIKDSIPAVRGCPGGCAFCGLVAHQGRAVMSRSEESILREVRRMTARKDFHGTISDVGGAAGNIYGSIVKDVERCRICRRPSCLFPSQCPNFSCDGERLLALVRTIAREPGVKHLYINSGMRLDLAIKQENLFRELIRNHVSGHLKVAPEHLNDAVLNLMRKNPAADFYEFRRRFEQESAAAGKEQYLIPLFISNFPGCTEREMRTVNDYLDREHWSPQQVQDYIPLPMTMGAAMYYTGKAPDGTPIEVNRGLAERRPQIQMLKKARPGSTRALPPHAAAPGPRDHAPRPRHGGPASKDAHRGPHRPR